MIDKIKELLGIKPPVDYNELLNEGAMIVDVWTMAEYTRVYIKGTKIIHLQTLSANSNIIKDKNNPISTCIASGIRSPSAINVLQAIRYSNVHNSGVWS